MTNAQRLPEPGQQSRASEPADGALPGGVGTAGGLGDLAPQVSPDPAEGADEMFYIGHS
jgi:hypothetical protein